MSVINVSQKTEMYFSYEKLLEAKGVKKSMSDIFAEEAEKERAREIAKAKQEEEMSKKTYTSAVEDYKKRHPEYASHVDSQLRLGKKVLEANGVSDVDRKSMTMEEYQVFFSKLMHSIPYDSSQNRDINVWSITKEGWEQMKNDPDYEAWVLGYTSEDRSINNPWANVPGYAPRFHTEKFGASIDEHIGQSFPAENKTEKEKEDDNFSWWKKRSEAMHESIMRHAEKLYNEISMLGGL